MYEELTIVAVGTREGEVSDDQQKSAFLPFTIAQHLSNIIPGLKKINKNCKNTGYQHNCASPLSQLLKICQRPQVWNKGRPQKNMMWGGGIRGSFEYPQLSLISCSIGEKIDKIGGKNSKAEGNDEWIIQKVPRILKDLLSTLPDDFAKKCLSHHRAELVIYQKKQDYTFDISAWHSLWPLVDNFVTATTTQETNETEV